jgi:membrane associated rhomboid family serine protease
LKPARPAAITLPVEPDAYVPIRYTASAELLNAWRFALEALGIPFEIVDLEDTDGWSVWVPERLSERAREVLRSTEAEERAELPKRVAERERAFAERRDALDNRLSYVPGAVFVLGIVFFASLAGLGNSLPTRPMFSAGANVLAATRSGEWFRALTALTLHANGQHLALNAVAAMFMLPLACEFWGLGVGIALTVLAGALGNLTEAYLGGNLVSLGASTALFAALGLAGGTRLMRHATSRKDVFLIVTALLVMFAMFGLGDTGPDPLQVVFPNVPHRSNVDVLAHVLGFAWGMGMGAGIRKAVSHRPQAWAQWTFGMVTVVGLFVAWELAVSGVPGLH